MNIASIGHRSRQDHLSPCCFGRAQQDSAAQKLLTLAIAGLHRQSVRVVNQSRGRGIIDLKNWLMPRGSLALRLTCARPRWPRQRGTRELI